MNQAAPLSIENTVIEHSDLFVADAVLIRTRLLCRRRILWLEHLASRAAQDPELQSAQSRVLLDLDSPIAEEQFLATHPQARMLQDKADACENQLMEHGDNRLQNLVIALQLDTTEMRLVQLCLAHRLDPCLGQIFANLSGQDGTHGPTEHLAARLNGYGRAAMWGPSTSLSRWRIISANARTGQLELDPFIISFLRGGSEVDPDLLNSCTVMNRPPEALTAWPVEGVATRVISALQTGIAARIQVMGGPLDGRKTFAANVSEALGRPLFVVNTDQIDHTRWAETRMLVQRQALLHNATVAWAGEHCHCALEPQPGEMDVEFTILETAEELAPAIGWHEERVRLPALSGSERKALWRRFLPVVQAWPAGKLDQLADRFRVSIGEIVHIAAQGDSTFDEVQQRTRELSHGKFGDVARLMECTFTRDDLYLPAQVSALLDEFLYEARVRNAFWEQKGPRRLFPRGVGQIGLLSGPPGTGKTMAAQVIAEELGLDLFRIDLASTMDKYIGETAKHLKRLFARAGQMNAVLLFDEADALFSRRTDTRDSLDRHANADTSYLLQLVEDYPGVALLATNKRQQIDEAFVRRIRYVFYLPRTEPAERLLIWTQVVGELADQDCAVRLDQDLRRLAADVSMSGAQIKTAALAAVFLSKRDQLPLNVEHLNRAVERQLVNQGGSVATEPRKVR